MKTRMLFNIILKVMGLFLLRDSLDAVNYAIKSFSFFPQHGISVLLYAHSVLLLNIVVIVLFILKTDWVIDILKLEKNINETIQLNIHRSTLLHISVIVLGGFLFIDEFPDFINEIRKYFKEKSSAYGSSGTDSAPLVLSLSKLAIATILLSYRRYIIKRIEYASRNRQDAT